MLRDWRYRTDEVNSALVNSSNTFKRIKVATALFLSCKEATISIDATVKKVEIVAAGTTKFIELLNFSATRLCCTNRSSCICPCMTGSSTESKRGSAPLTSC